MPTTSMNLVIHGAVRRDLDRFVDALAAFPEGDAPRAAALGRAWDNFDAMLTDHHEGEHETAWAHLERAGVPRTLLDELDTEHEAMARAMAGARAAMAELVRRPTGEQASAARAAMEELRATTLTHLEHEEAELEPFYLEHADHPEIKAMGREFSRRNKPSFAGRFFAWVTDGATPQQDAALKENVPGPVLAVINAIWGRGYRKDIAPVWR